MRLAGFIETHLEQIIAEWEIFARSSKPGATMGRLALRDHAGDILRATARDMRSAQSDRQQSEKSQGRGASGLESERLEQASSVHGIGRVSSGFNILEVISEYRALRASILRLWRKNSPDTNPEDIEEVTRFNESIDQSLAEAVLSYTKRVDQSRQMFLAVLAHDLRNPLNCIMMSAQAASPPDCAAELSLISSSAQVMARLISDLIDFAGTGMGGKLPVSPGPMDLGQLSGEVVQEVQGAHPTRVVQLHTSGDLTGTWDASRLRQVISNLLGNAIQHGSEKGVVTLSARGDGPEVVFTVQNEGEPIPPELLPTIFDPLVRGISPEPQRRRRPGSIGLGLYIAREVVVSHGGSIEVTSSAEGETVFAVRLPRLPASQ